MSGFKSFLTFRRNTLLTTLALVLALMAVSVGTALAYVTTDKADYAPGETVTISGDGFKGNELIDITVQAPYGTETGGAKADRNGAFTWTFDLPADDSALGWYAYVAHGQKSDIIQAGTFSDHGAGSPAQCITDNNPTTSFQVEVGGTKPNGSTAGERNIIINADSGNVITSICIKSGVETFALEDPDGTPGTGDENSAVGPGKKTDPQTSAHSVEITADGTYGIDLELGDGIDGCYTVSGIGTAQVTVTVVGDWPDANDSENCKDLSHTDNFTADGTSTTAGEIDLAKTTTCPAAFPIYSTATVQCDFSITFTAPTAGTATDLLIVDAVPAEFDVTFLDLTGAAGTEAQSLPQGHGGNTATRIEWYIPLGTTGTVTLVVDIETVPGQGGKGIFKPTSCGPLPINEGAIAYQFSPGASPNEIEGGFIVKVDTDEDGVPDTAVIVVGLSNQLVSQATAGNKPCDPDFGTFAVTAAISGSDVVVTWNDQTIVGGSGNDIEGYNVYRGPTGGPFSLVNVGDDYPLVNSPYTDNPRFPT